MGETGVANHQLDCARISGVPMPRRVEAVTGSVATTAARARISPSSVSSRTPTPSLRATPTTSIPCSTGRSRPRASWFGTACIPSAGSTGAPNASCCMVSIANWYDVCRSSSPKTSRKNGRSTSSRIRPEMPWRSSDSCSVMSAPVVTRSRGRRIGSLHRIRWSFSIRCTATA